MKPRNRRGTMAEFGPAMVLFICFIMIPMIDISAIPVRYFIAQGVLSETTQKLSLADKRTEAVAIATGDSWKNLLNACGVRVHAQPLKLVVCGKSAEDKITLLPGEQVPSAYLPNGSKGPCVYAMELTVAADIPPLYHGSSGLPGFTAPITMQMSSRSNWENLSRDPATRKYFINE